MDNILGLMGLAKKAGKLETGNDMSKEAVYNQKTRLVLISNDASERTANDFESIKEEYNFFVIFMPYSKSEIGDAISASSCSVCAVTDINFAAEIANKIAEATKGEDEKHIAERLTLSKKRKKEREIRKKTATNFEGKRIKEKKTGKPVAEKKHTSKVYVKKSYNSSDNEYKKTEKRYEGKGSVKGQLDRKKNDRTYSGKQNDKKFAEEKDKRSFKKLSSDRKYKSKDNYREKLKKNKYAKN